MDLHFRLRGLQSGAHAESDAQRSSGAVRPGRGVSQRRCNAFFRASPHEKLTPQMLENSRMTQIDQEIDGSAFFFRSPL
jgi:hypothetical protein